MESSRNIWPLSRRLLGYATPHRNPLWLVIAHRLSSRQHADPIVVLDRDRIVESATHDQPGGPNLHCRRFHERQCPP